MQHLVGQLAAGAMIHQTATSSAVQHGTQQTFLQLPAGDFGDDLRRMNADRVKLDEELREAESKEIKILVDQFVSLLTSRLGISFSPLLPFSFVKFSIFPKSGTRFRPTDGTLLGTCQGMRCQLITEITLRNVSSEISNTLESGDCCCCQILTSWG